MKQEGGIYVAYGRSNNYDGGSRRKSCDCNDKFVSLEYKVKLNREGKGQVVFDTSRYSLFTIAIENISPEVMEVQVEVSPNQCAYKKDSVPFLVPGNGALETYIVRYFLKYTIVNITGCPQGIAYVYLQGHRA